MSAITVKLFAVVAGLCVLTTACGKSEKPKGEISGGSSMTSGETTVSEMTTTGEATSSSTDTVTASTDGTSRAESSTQQASGTKTSTTAVNQSTTRHTTTTAKPTTTVSSDDPYLTAPSDVFPIKDMYDMRGISIIGDSISHGANVPKIPDQSYVGLFKQAVDSKWKGGNYGFTSLLATLSNNSGTYREIHNISYTGSWTILQTGDYLGCYALRGTQQGNCLYVKPKKKFKYFTVFYESVPGGGNFEVQVNGVTKETINTQGSVRNTAARSGFIATGFGDKTDIQLVNSNGKPVTITGIGYYNSKEGVVVNNYSRSGLQLIQLDNEVIQKMCQASVVVFALGHNDMWQAGSDALFTAKINVVIDAVKKNKCRLIVQDFTWGTAQGAFVRKELKRLAESCGGVFHDYSVSMKGQIQDGSHPYPSGHKILADTLCADFKL